MHAGRKTLSMDVCAEAHEWNWTAQPQPRKRGCGEQAFGSAFISQFLCLFPFCFVLQRCPICFTFWDRLEWVRQLLFPGRAELSHRDTLLCLRNNCSILSQRKNGVCCLMTHGSVVFLISHHCDKILDMKQLGLDLRGLHSVATVGEGPQLVLLHLQVGKH